MTRLLCKVGIHQWQYTPAVYDSEQNERLAPSCFAGDATMSLLP